MAVPGSYPPKFCAPAVQDLSFNVVLWRLETLAQQLAERPSFRAARRSAEQLLELYTIRSDGLLDGRLEDRYEWTDRMDSNRFLLQLYDVSEPSTGLIPVRSFLSL